MHMKSRVYSCTQYTALAHFISLHFISLVIGGGGMAKKDVLLGGGYSQKGGQKVRIKVGRPFWMSPKLISKLLP